MAWQKKINTGDWALLGADNRLICDYDGIIEVSKASSSQVLTEPIEGGELAAFNKVQTPDAVRVTLSLSDDPASQSAALERLKALKAGTGKDYLCKLVTLSDVTDNLALESIGESHSATQNANLLFVELSFIRVKAVQASGSAVTWAPKKATSSNQQNQGRTQSYALKRLTS